MRHHSRSRLEWRAQHLLAKCRGERSPCPFFFGAYPPPVKGRQDWIERMGENTLGLYSRLREEVPACAQAVQMKVYFGIRAPLG
eukprot:54409-Eustigmatos_ZCMA.PRE.1